jgi:hypothetical protein
LERGYAGRLTVGGSNRSIDLHLLVLLLSTALLLAGLLVIARLLLAAGLLLLVQTQRWRLIRKS